MAQAVLRRRKARRRLQLAGADGVVFADPVEGPFAGDILQPQVRVIVGSYRWRQKDGRGAAEEPSEGAKAGAGFE